LNRLQINSWQVLLGGIFMVPITILFQKRGIDVNPTTLISVFWLTFMVSIVGVGLWLWMLQKNASQASYFMFLCPIFGFLIAHFLLNEPIFLQTFIGTGVVLFALYLGVYSQNVSK
ncbi:MAG: EamA family transporter, partial [Leadbetterella sp.]